MRCIFVTRDRFPSSMYKKLEEAGRVEVYPYGEAPWSTRGDGGRGLEVYRNEEVIQVRGHGWEEILQLKPDVVITRDIVRPAYHAFRAKGVKILLAEGATAREALEKWRRGKLREFLQSLYTSLDTATTELIDASADGALCTCIEHPCRGDIRADLFSRCSSQATCLTPAAFGETWLTPAEPPSGRR